MTASADQIAVAPTASDPIGHASLSRRGYVLTLLMLIMGMNQVDRGIVAILLDSIKAEMKLTDTTMGLVVGSGFAIIYALASIPLARVADRHSRKWVIGIGLFIYSIMAAGMGLAQNVVQLVAARAAVAVGEASGSAPSSSLISEYYPPKDRPRAMSIWSAGSYLGLLLGMSAGGWLNQQYGWRVALWATAAPGLVLAFIFSFTVREPQRGAEHNANVPAMRVALRQLSGNPTYMLLLGGFVSQAFVMYSLTTWAPSLLGRVHHMTPSEVGVYAGLSKGLCSLLGAIAGGYATKRIAGSDLKRMAIVPIIGTFLLPFAVMTFLLADDRTIALSGLFLSCFLLPIHYASALAMLHGVVAREIRSLASAIVFSAMALGGLALGPLIVGIASDAFAAEGVNSLRFALVIPAQVGFLSAALFFLSSRTILRDAALTPQD